MADLLGTVVSVLTPWKICGIFSKSVRMYMFTAEHKSACQADVNGWTDWKRFSFEEKGKKLWIYHEHFRGGGGGGGARGRSP